MVPVLYMLDGLLSLYHFLSAGVYYISTLLRTEFVHCYLVL